MNPKDNICKQIDNLLQAIRDNGGNITKDQELNAESIKRQIRSLHLNAVMYDDN